jgi:hypothetical protein
MAIPIQNATAILDVNLKSTGLPGLRLGQTLSDASGNYRRIWSVDETTYNQYVSLQLLARKSEYEDDYNTVQLPSFNNAVLNGIRLDAIMEKIATAQFYVTPELLVFNSAGETKTATVTAPDANWTISYANQSWLTVTKTNNTTITITCTANTSTTDNRGVTIYVSHGNMTRSLVLSQAATTVNTGDIIIRGTVLDANTNNPIPSAQVDLYFTDPQKHTFLNSVTTTTSGTFSVTIRVTETMWNAIIGGLDSVNSLMLSTSKTDYGTNEVRAYGSSLPTFSNAIANGYTVSDIKLMPNASNDFYFDKSEITLPATGGSDTVNLMKGAATTYTYETIPSIGTSNISTTVISDTQIQFNISRQQNTLINSLSWELRATNTVTGITISMTIYQEAGSDIEFDVNPKTLTFSFLPQTPQTLTVLSSPSQTWSIDDMYYGQWINATPNVSQNTISVDVWSAPTTVDMISVDRSWFIDVTKTDPLPSVRKRINIIRRGSNANTLATFNGRVLLSGTTTPISGASLLFDAAISGYRPNNWQAQLIGTSGPDGRFSATMRINSIFWSSVSSFAVLPIAPGYTGSIGPTFPTLAPMPSFSEITSGTWQIPFDLRVTP